MSQIPESLKNVYEEIKDLNTDIELTSEWLQDTYKLNHFEASCILYMIDQGEYVPELEDLYCSNPAEKCRRCGKIKFINDMFPYKKEDVADINDENPLDTADMESYVTLGYAEWIQESEESNQKDINMYKHMAQHTNKVKADLREAIANRDKKFLWGYFHDYTEEKTIEFLKQFKCTDEQIRIAVEIMFLKDDEL